MVRGWRRTPRYVWEKPNCYIYCTNSPKGCSLDVKEYRHISLIGSVYKIFPRVQWQGSILWSAGQHLSGFTVGSRTCDLLMVSHLLFLYDTWFLLWECLEQLRYLKCVLCFELVSGWKINRAKSALIPVGIVPDIEKLTQIVDYKVLKCPWDIWVWLEFWI